jgi:hypothetical protein
MLVSRGLEATENKYFIRVIKQLDKHTLNMYTALRAGLGTRELSWIRLGIGELQGGRKWQRFQEEWQQ